jgi:hypothetical protein
MKTMANDLYQTLDNSLERLQQSDLRLDQLKTELSEGQQELRPLLALAQSLQSLEPQGPKPSFVRNARVRIWNQVRGSLTRRDRRVSRLPSFNVTLRRALAGALLALLLVFSGLGVASASALPGDALYDLKRGFESVQIALAFSQAQEAGLLARFTQQRVEEIEALSQLDRPSDLAQALDDYTQTMDEFLNLTASLGDEWEEDLADVQGVFAHNTEVLQGVQERVPESAQDAIQQAIERSTHGQSVLEILQQGGNPSELAPGQQDRPDPESDNQFNDRFNNGNAYGRNKEKNNGQNNRGNRGRGNPHNEGNEPVDPQENDDDDQDD